MKKDYVIKILFIEHSLEEAEQIISLLRNSGIAVRPARATNAEQTQAAITELEPDIVMFDPAVETLQLVDALRLMDASGRDYSLLGLIGKMDNDTVADLFVQGTAHFEVPDAEALALMEDLRARLPGYLVPRLVRELAGDTSKRPI